MFLGIFDLDEYVPIPAPAHRFSSGAAYAPTTLTYSIYEEGGTTGLDENVDMAPASPFDSITGCYLSRRQLTADAGFERNKTYLVVVKATVDSVPAIDMHVFQVRAKSAVAGDAMTLGELSLAAIASAVATAMLVTPANKINIDSDNAIKIQKMPVTLAAADTSGLPKLIDLNTKEEIAAEVVAEADIPTTAEIKAAIEAEGSSIASILEDTGTTIPGLINSDSGAGAISHAYTLTDSADGTPIDGAEVWVSTDAAGVNVIASGTTNSAGIVTFMLDAGTYYFWRRRSGYNFVNPDVEIVSA